MSKIIPWEKFQAVVCDHLGLHGSEVSENTNIYKDIGLDSLGIVSLGIKIQAEFNVTVPLSEIPVMQTIGEMYTKLLEFA